MRDTGSWVRAQSVDECGTVEVEAWLPQGTELGLGAAAAAIGGVGVGPWLACTCTTWGIQVQRPELFVLSAAPY